MAEAKPVSTPSEPGQHLRGDDCPPRGSANPEVIRNYQACIGSLMYLAVMTRGDCAYAVNQCARFLSNPGASHVAAAKRIMRYVAGTADQGIVYRRSEDPRVANVLTASADADHGGADDRRSVSGWVVMLNGAMVSWASKRQPVTAISSTESEFYSVSQCAMECVYLRRVMSLLGYEQSGPTLIAQDNYAYMPHSRRENVPQSQTHRYSRVQGQGVGIRQFPASEALEDRWPAPTVRPTHQGSTQGSLHTTPLHHHGMEAADGSRDTSSTDGMSAPVARRCGTTLERPAPDAGRRGEELRCDSTLERPRLQVASQRESENRIRGTFELAGMIEGISDEKRLRSSS